MLLSCADEWSSSAVIDREQCNAERPSDFEPRIFGFCAASLCLREWQKSEQKLLSKTFYVLSMYYQPMIACKDGDFLGLHRTDELELIQAKRPSCFLHTSSLASQTFALSNLKLLRGIPLFLCSDLWANVYPPQVSRVHLEYILLDHKWIYSFAKQSIDFIVYSLHLK